MTKTSINLGAGNDVLDTNVWINHDLKKHRPEIEVSFDLEDIPWPLDDNTFDEVRMFDVLEHLNNIVGVMDEVWRILKPDGILDCKVCGYKNENFWVDPTHKHAFAPNSMDYFDPTTSIGQIYDFYTDKKWKIVGFSEKNNNYYWRLKPIKEKK